MEPTDEFAFTVGPAASLQHSSLQVFSDSPGVPGCGGLSRSHPQLVPIFNMLSAPDAALLARLRSSEPTQHVDALPAVCELNLNARYLFVKLKEAFG